MAPLATLGVTIAGLVFERSAVQTQILSELQRTIGKEGAEAVHAIFEQSRKPSSGTVATLIGLVTLLFGASGAFGELRNETYSAICGGGTNGLTYDASPENMSPTAQ